MQKVQFSPELTAETVLIELWKCASYALKEDNDKALRSGDPPPSYAEATKALTHIDFRGDVERFYGKSIRVDFGRFAYTHTLAADGYDRLHGKGLMAMIAEQLGSMHGSAKRANLMAQIAPSKEELEFFTAHGKEAAEFYGRAWDGNTISASMADYSDLRDDLLSEIRSDAIHNNDIVRRHNK